MCKSHRCMYSLGRSILPVVVTSRRSFGLGSENRSISDCHPWEGVCIDIGSGGDSPVPADGLTPRGESTQVR